MKVTIKDVAQRAGVSPSTVSRVFSGNTSISKKTRAKVRKAMDELGYYPHAIARSLVMKNSATIGLVIHQESSQALSNTFFPEVIKGIADVLEEEEFDLLLVTKSRQERRKDKVLDLLRGHKVDGILILTSKVQDPLLPALRKGGYPFVVLGRTDRVEDCSINNDNVEASFQAVQHLITLGHGQIGLITGSEEYTVSMDRRRGYEEALQKAGIRVEEDLMKQVDFTMEGSYSATLKLLSHNDPPTAIFAADDSMAAGVLRACSSRGFKVPKDISVVGFNDDPIALLMDPPLTTISIPTWELGQRAAAMLFSLIKGDQINERQIILPTQLCIRSSTSPPNL